MSDRALRSLVAPKYDSSADFESLMSWRVRNVLLVSSLYDSFVFDEDEALSERLLSDYLDLNLRYAPSITRSSNAAEALEAMRQQPIDLIISTPKVGNTTTIEGFLREARVLDPKVPFVLLANNAREASAVGLSCPPNGMDRVFVWSGDVRLFLAIIKSVEDRMNARHDSETTGVPVLLLVENDVQFYSSYLPLLYSELMEHSRSLLTDGLNRVQKLFRMRSRPKILLATTYEEGARLFEQHREHLLGAIIDASFPRGGEIDDEAGIEFASLLREGAPDRPILMQSYQEDKAAEIRSLRGFFVNKGSPTLLHELRRFMREQLGFGEFCFRMPDGSMVGTASDLMSLQAMIEKVPIESIGFHGRRNDFSTWLTNRSEFSLARDLRPRKVEEFEDPERIRRYLLSVLERHRARTRAGVVAEFSRGTFDGASGIARIGSGSLGGKGRGLAFFHWLLEQYDIGGRFLDVNIFVPPTAVLATGVFDRFMSANGLMERALSSMPDEAIAAMFMEGSLPDEAMEALQTYLERVTYPLAVRSSSLLEDSSHVPFAGIYQTHMIPNGDGDPGRRLDELAGAVKMVYASTYFAAAKAYIQSTPHRLEEEKMAVCIQRVVGRRHGDNVYPMVAGVADSHDFYPVDGMRSEDGVASVVLGLGKMVADGGRCVRFSPKHPRRLYQFSSPSYALQSAQREFYGLNVAPETRGGVGGDGASSTVRLLELDAAEQDGVLGMVGSVYDRDADAVYDGISRPGPRLVTMAGLLKTDVFPFAEVLSFLLEVGAAAFSCPVEIEFAADMRARRSEQHQFGFLQIRPVVTERGAVDVDVEAIAPADMICLSRSALGNRVLTDVTDLVYVPEKTFDRARTLEISAEVGLFNARLAKEGRPFVLMGPGRWGSADRWLGIPVSWSQISSAACIVETDLHDMKGTPSQGTHFFHNITSLGRPLPHGQFRKRGRLFGLGMAGCAAALREVGPCRASPVR